jgi:hypothetical protein
VVQAVAVAGARPPAAAVVAEGADLARHRRLLQV